MNAFVESSTSFNLRFRKQMRQLIGSGGTTDCCNGWLFGQSDIVTFPFQSRASLGWPATWNGACALRACFEIRPVWATRRHRPWDRHPDRHETPRSAGCLTSLAKRRLRLEERSTGMPLRLCSSRAPCTWAMNSETDSQFDFGHFSKKSNDFRCLVKSASRQKVL